MQLPYISVRVARARARARKRHPPARRPGRSHGRVAPGCSRRKSPCARFARCVSAADLVTVLRGRGGGEKNGRKGDAVTSSLEARRNCVPVGQVADKLGICRQIVSLFFFGSFFGRAMGPICIGRPRLTGHQSAFFLACIRYTHCILSVQRSILSSVPYVSLPSRPFTFPLLVDRTTPVQQSHPVASETELWELATRLGGMQAGRRRRMKLGGVAGRLLVLDP